MLNEVVTVSCLASGGFQYPVVIPIASVRDFPWVLEPGLALLWAGPLVRILLGWPLVGYLDRRWSVLVNHVLVLILGRRPWVGIWSDLGDGRADGRSAWLVNDRTTN